MERACTSTVEDIIHFTAGEFEMLLQQVAPYILKPRAIYDCPESDGERRTRQTRLSVSSRLFMFLDRLANGTKFAKLASDSGCSQETCRVDFIHVAYAICDALKNEIEWPNAMERREMHGLISAHLYPSIIAVIDGTYQYLASTKDLVHIFYNGHKKRPLWLHQIVVNWRGRIIHHSFVPGGVTNDRGQFNDTLLGRTPMYFSAGEHLLADRGYHGTNPDEVLVRCGDDVPYLESFRSLIERVHNCVKDRWKLCWRPWPKTASVWHAPVAFRAAIVLTNWLNRVRDRYPTNP